MIELGHSGDMAKDCCTSAGDLFGQRTNTGAYAIFLTKGANLTPNILATFLVITLL